MELFKIYFKTFHKITINTVPVTLSMHFFCYCRVFFNFSLLDPGGKMNVDPGGKMNVDPDP